MGKEERAINRQKRKEKLKRKTDQKRKDTPPSLNILHQDKRYYKVNYKGVRPSTIYLLHMKRLSNNEHSLKVDSKELYDKVKKLLEQEETNFYIYNPKENKMTIMLLKELNHSFEESEIMEEL